MSSVLNESSTSLLARETPSPIHSSGLGVDCTTGTVVKQIERRHSREPVPGLLVVERTVLLHIQPDSHKIREDSAAWHSVAETYCAASHTPNTQSDAIQPLNCTVNCRLLYAQCPFRKTRLSVCCCPPITSGNPCQSPGNSPNRNPCRSSSR